MTVQPLNLIIGIVILVGYSTAAQHLGWWVAFALFVLFAVLTAVLLVVLAIANNRFFDNAQRKAAENYRLETEAQRVKALREIGRLQAHTKRSRPEQSLWGRN